jgi:predicted deacetylase
MFFSIRDDDTSYFTKPDDISKIYSDIWDICPVGLSVVPFHANTKTGALPQEFWKGNNVYPIGDNIDLVKFLKDEIEKGHIYIMLHGYSHKDELDGYEFEKGEQLFDKVAKGKKYLEAVLRTSVTTFVPPHNELSRDGYLAVVKNGLNICSHVAFKNYHLTTSALLNKSIQKIWHIINRKKYPFPIKFSTHVEYGYDSLTPKVSLDDLLSSFHHCRRFNGWFCLATHYWEFGQKNGMKEIFDLFWKEIRLFREKIDFRKL